MTGTLLEAVARAVRKQKLERSNRFSTAANMDPPTEHELADAQAAIDTIHAHEASELAKANALLAESRDAANATLTAIDKYNLKNCTYIVGPSFLRLGKLLARIDAHLEQST